MRRGRGRGSGLGRIETPPKTDAGRRTVALPEVVVEALADHLARWAAPGDCGAVFTEEQGRPLGPRVYPPFDEAKRRWMSST
jgi:hypothetical protein